MNINKTAWIRINDLNETEKNMFFEHYKDNEDVVILHSIGNVEYRITNIDDDNIYLEFTGKIYKTWEEN